MHARNRLGFELVGACVVGAHSGARSATARTARGRGFALLGAVLGAAFAGPVLALDPFGMPEGVPEDWSQRHVVYTNVQTYEEAVANGTLDQWEERAEDPRFLLAVKNKQAEKQKKDKSASPITARSATTTATAVAAAAKKPPPPPPPPPSLLGGDWRQVMGGAAGVGSVRTFPAKYRFTIDSKSCTDDFVVFTTATAGATSSGTTWSQTGTFTGQPTAGQTVTLTNNLYTPVLTLTLTAHASNNTGTQFAIGTGTTATAANLANAIKRNGGSVGVTASSSAGVVTITSITTFITTTNLTTTEGLDNFSFATATAGSGTKGQPTIFALHELYKPDCATVAGPLPEVMWSYNTTTTGTGSVARTSPVLSLDGSQVAFVQSTSGGVAQLVLLKGSSTISPGTVGAPTALTSTAANSYRGCTAPCMTVLDFNGNPNPNATLSAPFVDYGGDVLWVGDDSGKLHKFTGVFSGTPAEVTTSPWPVTVQNGAILSSPVFDFSHGLVFVGGNGGAGGNKLFSVSTGGTVTASGTIGSSSTVNGVRDAPILDPTAGKVYVFLGADNSSPTPKAAVYQFAYDFTGGNTGSKQNIGLSNVSNTLDTAIGAGALDDAYYSSGDSSNPSGNLYVCGSASGTAQRPTLWRVPISSNTMGTAVEGPLLVSANTSDGCSPVTLFKNGSTEYLYASVSANGSAQNCTSGCVYMYPTPLTSTPSTVFNQTSSSGSISKSIEYFMSVSATVLLNTTEASVWTTLTAAQAGLYGGMTITLSSYGNAYTYTLRKNGVDTNIVCSITSGGTSCSDTAHSIYFAAGDTIDVKVVRTGSNNTENRTHQAQIQAILGVAGLAAPGGTGGIIVDNTATGGGSQIYYSTRTSPGLAVQASQAALQ